MAFDIREHTDRASAITPDDVDPAAFRDLPLTPHTIRCLRYRPIPTQSSPSS
jgi:hypothetical protein